MALESIPGSEIRETNFAELTTLHLGGTPICAVECTTSEALCEVVKLFDDNRIKQLIVGGGSNLVVADGALDICAVIVATKKITIDPDTGIVRAEAGACWDDVVAASVHAGLGGIECLSGIPGSAGATPVQNVGAYGVEIADVLTQVKLYDRTTGEVSWVPASGLELAYRYSNLKFTHRAVVLEIELQLTTDGLSAPLRFGELARKLGVDTEGDTLRVDARLVRDAVMELRRGKGMVYDEADHDTWSAGSFFTNPIVSVETAQKVRASLSEADAQTMPCFDAGGKKKLSAAWLIDRAGLTKGYPGQGLVRLSSKHTLALTNRGGASTAELVELARDVRAKVQQRFGVLLEPEPVWVGVSIDN
ncbi:UDP-N-acetylenolpyruvoylglucosamine reductase [Corynebacterium kutscheri]|uniref:UDP-N-acetylenolpyruvoylglucosamine reductase n=1 Tax=Corynebacterium kutscheri TaxID=35755 RepID=A0A0F6QYB3_9CORY|nr:UDP-N-acetylmuramate dehydrogenase [Corynebacterium kutscheri]AKE40467.1 UDP-N-acetylmuramate dehydrogenase [Corynebacterium kutscheri]VEH05150.1 UDP-N-acetylenolpyruvoylglucosamine reductase [Corynebacterium kutscheri]VEH10861.1 UDP-N-acetylenolpyruvoylglucosamine reductase [Corynebacterium kutscheri]VEH80662.1 UDP-N-acetylenolpyruvoylglucosamine reductase [Corynebacterium kutscheri]